jgi:hypothetical protein
LPTIVFSAAFSYAGDHNAGGLKPPGCSFIQMIISLLGARFLRQK